MYKISQVVLMKNFKINKNELQYKKVVQKKKYYDRIIIDNK